MSSRRYQLPDPRQCVPRVRLVADMDPDGGFRAGHGAEEAPLAVPLHARVPGCWRGAGASPKLLPAEVAVVQGNHLVAVYVCIPSLAMSSLLPLLLACGCCQLTTASYVYPSSDAVSPRK